MCSTVTGVVHWFTVWITHSYPVAGDFHRFGLGGMALERYSM